MSNYLSMSSSKIYCTRAFDHVQLLDNGEMTPCCPPWVNHYSLGNINKQSYEEIWNGKKAKEFRESILDGSYKYCNSKSCPHLKAQTHCVGTIDKLKKRNVGGSILDDIINGKTELNHGPHEVQFCYDRSCNLSCPSCRREIIMVSGKEQQKLLDMQNKLQTDFLLNAEVLVVTGSGDAFASPVFRKFLQTLTNEQAPKLRHINILTNGLLLKRYWATLSDYSREKIQYISVSIDAATPETYAINRRGGDWVLLQENLEFIKELRKNGQIKGFQSSIVVQDNNYKELLNFILMSEMYKVDRVQLQIIEPDFIRDLGYGDYLNEWLAKAVHEKTHPNHGELLSILKDDFFKIYIERYNGQAPTGTAVAMGLLNNLRCGLDISQYDQLKIEEQKQQEENKRNLKDVWYEGQTYFIDSKDLKYVNGTDVALILPQKVVMWDKNRKEWIECQKDTLEFRKYFELIV